LQASKKIVELTGRKTKQFEMNLVNANQILAEKEQEIEHFKIRINNYKACGEHDR